MVVDEQKGFVHAVADEVQSSSMSLFAVVHVKSDVDVDNKVRLRPHTSGHR